MYQAIAWGFMRLISQIKQAVDRTGKNPHELSMQTGISYPAIWKLYNAEVIPDTTRIGTLVTIARTLGVSVDDLYIVETK
jgi:hypothetical protein